MDDLAGILNTWLAAARWVPLLKALATLAVGFLLARLAGGAVHRATHGRANAEQAMVARRLAFHLVMGISGVAALRYLGFDLSILLGAAGVLTVAIGFASQTSASNLISGLFLLGERPFTVGDVIKVGDTTGEVVSLQLLSMTLRTLDNLAVRIPNETLLKSEITNFTRYPIRRVDIDVTVAYGADLEVVRRLLDGVAESLPLCLDEPRPSFVVRAFGATAMELRYSVWTRRDNHLEVSSALRLGIYEVFRREEVPVALAPQVVRTIGETPPEGATP